MKKKEVEEALNNHADWIEHLAAQLDRTDKQIEQTSASLDKLAEAGRETERRLKELGEATDKRIGDLVSAIGKLLPRPQNGKAEGGEKK